MARKNISKQPRTKPVRALERGLDVLLCFAAAADELSIAELQAKSKLSRATLYRLLHTLQKKGFVQPGAAPSTYQLDYVVMRLAHSWLAETDIVHVAEPFLKELWDETDETIALYVPVGDTARLCIRELRSRQPLSYSRGVGYMAPLIEGASGKAMLAFLAEPTRREVLRSIQNVRARDRLRSELARIARDGYSVTHSELIDGAIGIAAPLLSMNGEVCGSLCAFGAEKRIQGSLRDRYVRLVAQAAERLSAILGHKVLADSPARSGARV